jgi:hypothetical protein
MKSLLDQYIEAQERRRSFRLCVIWIAVMVLFLWIGPMLLGGN